MSPSQPTVTVEPESGSTVLFDTLVSNMQRDVEVGTDAITGNLAFIEGGLAKTGYLSGDGHFIALKFSTEDWNNFDKVEVGLDPSQGSGLVDVKPDTDKNGVFKVTSTEQKFVVKTTAGDEVVTKEYSLEDLYLVPKIVPEMPYINTFEFSNDYSSTDYEPYDDVTDYRWEFGASNNGPGTLKLNVDKGIGISRVTLNNTELELDHSEPDSGSTFNTNYYYNCTLASNEPDVSALNEFKVELDNGTTYTFTIIFYVGRRILDEFNVVSLSAGDFKEVYGRNGKSIYTLDMPSDTEGKQSYTYKFEITLEDAFSLHPLSGGAHDPGIIVKDKNGNVLTTTNTSHTSTVRVDTVTLDHIPTGLEVTYYYADADTPNVYDTLVFNIGDVE